MPNYVVILFLLCVACTTKVMSGDLWIQVADHDVYISFPDSVEPQINKEMSVLMAIHGSGRSAASYCPDKEDRVPFYIHQRNLAHASGYVFVAVSNGSDTWGTDHGLKVMDQVYQYVQRKYSTKKEWVLWASSAGGVLMMRLIKEYPERVKKVLGTFPVYDLEEAYERRKGSNFPFNDNQSVAAVNPAHHPSDLTNTPMLIFHGKRDEAVPVKLHSLRLRDDVNKLGGHVKLVKVRGGHSTSNWHVYKDRMIRRFLKITR